MTEKKHTPGPWAAVIRQGKTWVLTNPDSNPFVGQVIASQTTCPDWEANARLIAAAPELLAACQMFSGWANIRDGSSIQSLEVRDVVKAAIAKALGQN